MNESRSPLQRLLSELKRRKVFRVAAVYAVVAWAVIQVSDTIFPRLALPDWTVTLVIVLALAGFPLALVLSWMFDVTPEGVRREHEAGPSDPDPSRPVSAPSRNPRPAQIAVVGVAIVVIAGAVGWWARPDTADATVAAGAETVAILPFTTSGADVQHLGEGMVDLLSTNLDAVGAIRTINPRTVIRYWRRHASEGAIDAEGALAVGREVNAGSVLLGSVVAAGDQVRLSAELRALEGGTLASARVDGSAADLLSLVDSLSVHLLREVWRSRSPLPSIDIRAVTTGSVEAIREYLDGERHYRRMRWDSAAVAFERATEHDSAFALAFARLAHTQGWKQGIGAGAKAMNRAVEYADRLPPATRSLVGIGRMVRVGDPAALDSVRAYTRRYPDDPEGWFMAGEVAFHGRARYGSRPEDIYHPFEQVLALDPALVPALIHPFDQALLAGDTARLTGYLDLLSNHLAPEQVEPYRLARRVLTAEPDSAERALERFFAVITEHTVARGLVAGVVAGALNHGPLRPATVLDRGGRVTRALPPHHTWARLWWSNYPRYVVGAGRPWDAMRQLERYGPTDLRSTRITPVLAGYLPETAADEVLAEMDAGSPAERQWAGIVRAELALVRGDAPAARAALARMPAEAAAEDRRTLRGLVTALDGWIELVEGDTAAGLDRMDEGLRQIGFNDASLGAAPVRFARAATLAARPDSRAEGIRLLEHAFASDPLYAPLARLALAEARLALGDRDGAVHAYASVLHLWRDAEPEFQPRVEAVRRELERLTEERPAS